MVFFVFYTRKLPGCQMPDQRCQSSDLMASADRKHNAHKGIQNKQKIGLGEEKNVAQIEATFQKLAFETNKNWEKEIQLYTEDLEEKAIQKSIIGLEMATYQIGEFKSKKEDLKQISVAVVSSKNIKTNIRELEGALKLVAANAHFTGQEITPPFIRECLKDLLALHEKQVSIDNIQRTVAEYYKIKVADLLSKRRTRSITRPRQVAMALSKELTNHSLPEIGDAFGGRDHTTVLHACKKIVELQETDPSIREDYQNFLRTLTT